MHKVLNCNPSTGCNVTKSTFVTWDTQFHGLLIDFLETKNEDAFLGGWSIPEDLLNPNKCGINSLQQLTLLTLLPIRSSVVWAVGYSLSPLIIRLILKSFFFFYF